MYCVRNVRVCCHYTLHFGNSVHEVCGSDFLHARFDGLIWENVEGLLFVFVWQRYLGSIMKGNVGLSLNFYFSEQTLIIPSCVCKH